MQPRGRTEEEAKEPLTLSKHLGRHLDFALLLRMVKPLSSVTKTFQTSGGDTAKQLHNSKFSLWKVVSEGAGRNAMQVALSRAPARSPVGTFTLDHGRDFFSFQC